MKTRMTVTGGQVRQTGKRWCAVVVPLLAVSLSACAVGATGQGGGATASTENASNSAPRTLSRTPGEGQQLGAKTAAGAAESFVTWILQERYTQACLSTAQVADPKLNLEAMCRGPQPGRMMTSLRSAWAKPGVTLPPEAEVKVTNITQHGTTARVLDSEMTLDGRTLRELELIGAVGDVGSFHLSFDMRKKDGLWYVDTWNMEL